MTDGKGEGANIGPSGSRYEESAGEEADEQNDLDDDDEDLDDEVLRRDREWTTSRAHHLVYRQGSADLPGNYALGIPRWLVSYFGDIEQAAVLAQILYWHGPDSNGRTRLRFRDRDGCFVLQKTHRQLANEVGIRNARRVEKHLKTFTKMGLLDCEVHGIGKGRKTWIWLKPDAILEAYHKGCDLLEGSENQHDKCGGSHRSK